MKPEDIEQMERDREAGTEGPWWLGSDPSHYGTVSDVYGGFQGGASLPPLAISVGGDAGLQELEANARRIARVPDLEAEVLRLRGALESIANTPSEMTWGEDEEVRKAMTKMEAIAARAINGDAP